MRLGVDQGEGFAPASVIDAAAAGQPATELQLAVVGRNVFRDGRYGAGLVIDDAAHAQRVIEATRAHAGSRQILVDYDHQSVWGAKDGVGGQAPASGWVDPASLELRNGAIWGRVEWTAAASAKLQAREYRYVSPLLGFDKASQKVTRIFSVGLTNTPAINDLAAAAASQLEGSFMSKAIAQALGLAETATEAEILAKLAEGKAAAAAALAPIAQALGLAADAGGEAIAAAAVAAKAAGAPDPSKFAPIELVTTLQAQVSALTTGAAEGKATAAVDAAIAAGKLPPAQRDWGLGYAKKDLAGFEAFAAGAVVVVAPGKRQGDPPPKGGQALTAEDVAVCAALGVSEADFLKTRNEELAV